MGIQPFQAQLIIREHQRRPLPETVHLIGRQTVLLTIEQAVALLRSMPDFSPLRPQLRSDHRTREAASARQPFISDRTFFGLAEA